MKIFFSILLVFLLSGCEKDQPRATPQITVGGTSNPNLTLPALNSSSPPAELEKAQREYLTAYDRYVKMLRESGPQTMDTLHCLADYQKKYRLYQTLLEGSQTNRVTPVREN